MLRFNHANLNVTDLERSKKFYSDVFGLREVLRISEDDFTVVFMSDGVTGFRLELTYLKSKQGPYILGDNESHISFESDDFDSDYKKHKDMGIVCFENKAMEVYFVEDPDGYWQEVMRKR